MNYKMMLRTVAKEYNTTPREVEDGIKEAIKAAGLDMSPQRFIALCTAKVKREIKNENK